MAIRQPQILIVEDSDTMFYLYQTLLGDEYELRRATDGRQALLELVRFKPYAKNPVFTHGGKGDWDAFIRDGTQEGRYELLMPDGARVAVEYSATANMEPGQHLSILMFPPGRIGRDALPRSNSVLTSREREVLAMVAMGRSSSLIAAGLGVATSTVESHVRHCLDKLGARNRAHAIALGLRYGEITLELDRSE